MWLNPDRERAAEKYEEIRHSLIKIFTWRGISDAEELADEAINRVAEKVQDLRAGYSGDPALYFYGVAKNLFHEHDRTARQRVPLIEESLTPPLLADELGDESGIADREHECLEACLNKLSLGDREIIFRYYSKEKQAKIDYRKELAEELGVGVNALRVRIHRIRVGLVNCINRCLQDYQDEESS